jgi:acyl-CoA synthetase (NDP forming)/GNAT superfamily N-acetyltransferase
MTGGEIRPVDVALRDGSTVRVRPVQRGDVAGLRSLLTGLSDHSRWLRFLTAAADLGRAARSAAAPEGGVGLVATAGSPERILAHATYLRERPDRAEVAFEVADEWQGRGLATILLAHLAGAAERDGVSTFVAYVHPSNHRMIGVFRDSGFPVDVRTSADELVVEMPASPGEDARRRFEDRARSSAVAAVTHVLRPASVGVAGASSAGSVVLDNLVSYGFAGTVHDSPQPVDLAVVAGSPAAVLDASEAWGASGARALAVLAGGFADAGAAGRKRLGELLATCRRTGTRLVGPNCLGVINTDPHVRLNATVAKLRPTPGRVALASQSGALGLSAIAEATRRRVGISSFVSTGDKADLSGNDFLQYWEQDPMTDVVLLYLESLGNPRRFARIARDVALEKPIVAVKSGRTATGHDDSSTRTRAMVNASDVTVDALFAHAGVIRTDTLSEQLDVAALLASRPLPSGDCVTIISNARGPALACMDSCLATGLRLAPGSPLDLGSQAGADDYRRAVAGSDADAVVVIVTAGFTAEPRDVAACLRAASTSARPLVGVLMTVSDTELATLSEDGSVPLYRSPEEAARALGRVARYARWRRRPPDRPPILDAVDADAAAAVLATALSRGEGWLAPGEVDALLGAYGIAGVETRVAATPEDARQLAVELGGHVAVKAVAPGLPHKSDVGGVHLNVEPSAVQDAAIDVAAAVRRTGHEPDGFVVQRMAPPGVEMVAGVLADPDFGPVVACGPGGRTAELFGDATVGLAPLGRLAAAEMVRSLRSFPLLEGYRGGPQADVGAFQDILLRLSALAAAHPAVAEVDCDPVVAGRGGAVVIDARICVHRPAASRPFPALDR